MIRQPFHNEATQVEKRRVLKDTMHGRPVASSGGGKLRPAARCIDCCSTSTQCPLYPQKRTLIERVGISAFVPITDIALPP
jgi:hypothetical protein